VFLIMFNTGHALLLPGGRILRPRSVRTNGAEMPRNIIRQWPQTRSVRGFGQVKFRSWERTFHIHGQSTTASIPRQQTRQRAGNARGIAMASTPPGRGDAADMFSPLTVRILGQSPTATPSLSGTVRIREQATSCPCRRIALSTFAALGFPVPIHIILPYGNV
jgi:hypothetical protein